MKPKGIYYLLVGTLFAAVSAYAQSKQLTFEQVYESGAPKLLGRLPSIEGWYDDAHYLSRMTDRDNDKDQLFLVDVQTGSAALFLDYEQVNKDLPDGFRLQDAVTHTEKYQQFLWIKDDDLYHYDRSNKQFRRLTDDPGQERNPHFSPDNRSIAYTKNHNLFVLDLFNAREQQLTSDGSATVYNGYASWVYYEEILGRSSRYKAFWWSPDSRMLAYLRTDESKVPEFPLYRADGIRGELKIQRYPKAGDPVPEVKLKLISIDGNRFFTCDVDSNPDHYIAWPFFTPDSKELFFQWMNRDQDHLKIYALNVRYGGIREVYQEKQKSWVEFFEDIYFLDDRSGFILRSDRDGWRHLFHYDMEGSLKRKMTDGEWPVLDIAHIDQTKNTIFFHGWMTNSTERHLFRIDMDGKNLIQITQKAGTHQCDISPGASFYTDRFSAAKTPAILSLHRSDGTVVRELGNRKLKQFDEYRLGTVEFFTIPTEDGINLPATWVLPANFDTTEMYAVLFYVYGGPGRSMVRNSFRRLSRFYHAQNGIIVISVDHRGSGHFGKKGAAKMHRLLGKYETEDLISAVKWLRGKSFIDSTRIGITGGSYGGYVTCMALTAAAEYFTHGFANYSVTDWQLYDAVYTERYMDTPQDNPEGYKNASAIFHAEKYKGYLYITHGTMDDNVHMQNSIQLIDTLQNLNKSFDLMLYPNSRHGMGRAKYKHLRNESLTFWYGHFLNKSLEDITVR